jgi:hypothetical protein
LLAKNVGRIDAVILAYSNLNFDSETSPKMHSKVEHFEHLFYVLPLFSLQVARTELSDLGPEAVGLELALGEFSALGELLRPRTSHKRHKSDDLCHYFVSALF